MVQVRQMHFCDMIQLLIGSITIALFLFTIASASTNPIITNTSVTSYTTQSNPNTFLTTADYDGEKFAKCNLFSDPTFPLCTQDLTTVPSLIGIFPIDEDIDPSWKPPYPIHPNTFYIGQRVRIQFTTIPSDLFDPSHPEIPFQLAFPRVYDGDSPDSVYNVPLSDAVMDLLQPTANTPFYLSVNQPSITITIPYVEYHNQDSPIPLYIARFDAEREEGQTWFELTKVKIVTRYQYYSLLTQYDQPPSPCGQSETEGTDPSTSFEPDFSKKKQCNCLFLSNRDHHLYANLEPQCVHTIRLKDGVEPYYVGQTIQIGFVQEPLEPTTFTSAQLLPLNNNNNNNNNDPITILDDSFPSSSSFELSLPSDLFDDSEPNIPSQFILEVYYQNTIDNESIPLRFTITILSDQQFLTRYGPNCLAPSSSADNWQFRSDQFSISRTCLKCKQLTDGKSAYFGSRCQYIATFNTATNYFPLTGDFIFYPGSPIHIAVKNAYNNGADIPYDQLNKDAFIMLSESLNINLGSYQSPAETQQAPNYDGIDETTFTITAPSFLTPENTGEDELFAVGYRIGFAPDEVYHNVFEFTLKYVQCPTGTLTGTIIGCYNDNGDIKPICQGYHFGPNCEFQFTAENSLSFLTVPGSSILFNTLVTSIDPPLQSNYDLDFYLYPANTPPFVPPTGSTVAKATITYDYTASTQSSVSLPHLTTNMNLQWDDRNTYFLYIRSTNQDLSTSYISFVREITFPSCSMHAPGELCFLPGTRACNQYSDSDRFAPRCTCRDGFIGYYCQIEITEMTPSTLLKQSSQNILFSYNVPGSYSVSENSATFSQANVILRPTTNANTNTLTTSLSINKNLNLLEININDSRFQHNTIYEIFITRSNHIYSKLPFTLKTLPSTTPTLKSEIFTPRHGFSSKCTQRGTNSVGPIQRQRYGPPTSSYSSQNPCQCKAGNFDPNCSTQFTIELSSDQGVPQNPNGRPYTLSVDSLLQQPRERWKFRLKFQPTNQYYPFSLPAEFIDGTQNHFEFTLPTQPINGLYTLQAKFAHNVAFVDILSTTQLQPYEPIPCPNLEHQDCDCQDPYTYNDETHGCDIFVFASTTVYDNNAIGTFYASNTGSISPISLYTSSSLSNLSCTTDQSDFDCAINVSAQKPQLQLSTTASPTPPTQQVDVTITFTFMDVNSVQYTISQLLKYYPICHFISISNAYNVTPRFSNNCYPDGSELCEIGSPNVATCHCKSNFYPPNRCDVQVEYEAESVLLGEIVPVRFTAHAIQGDPSVSWYQIDLSPIGNGGSFNRFGSSAEEEFQGAEIPVKVLATTQPPYSTKIRLYWNVDWPGNKSPQHSEQIEILFSSPSGCPEAQNPHCDTENVVSCSPTQCVCNALHLGWKCGLSPLILGLKTTGLHINTLSSLIGLKHNWGSSSIQPGISTANTIEFESRYFNQAPNRYTFSAHFQLYDRKIEIFSHDNVDTTPPYLKFQFDLTDKLSYMDDSSNKKYQVVLADISTFTFCANGPGYDAEQCIRLGHSFYDTKSMFRQYFTSPIPEAARPLCLGTQTHHMYLEEFMNSNDDQVELPTNEDSADAISYCHCNEPTLVSQPNTFINGYTFYIGNHCQAKVYLPPGPFYFGQNITLDILFHDNIETRPNDWSLPTLTDVFTIIDMTDVVNEYQFPTTSLTGHLSTRSFLLPTEDQLAQGTTDITPSQGIHSKFKFKYTKKAQNVGGNHDDHPSKTSLSPSYFQIYDPCEWMRVVNHQYRCYMPNTDSCNPAGYSCEAGFCSPPDQRLYCECKPGFYGPTCGISINMVQSGLYIEEGTYGESYSIHLVNQGFGNDLSVSIRAIPDALPQVVPKALMSELYTINLVVMGKYHTYDFTYDQLLAVQTITLSTLPGILSPLPGPLLDDSFHIEVQVVHIPVSDRPVTIQRLRDLTSLVYDNNGVENFFPVKLYPVGFLVYQEDFTTQQKTLQCPFPAIFHPNLSTADNEPFITIPSLSPEQTLTRPRVQCNCQHVDQNFRYGLRCENGIILSHHTSLSQSSPPLISQTPTVINAGRVYIHGLDLNNLPQQIWLYHDSDSTYQTPIHRLSVVTEQNRYYIDIPTTESGEFIISVIEKFGTQRGNTAKFFATSDEDALVEFFVNTSITIVPSSTPSAPQPCTIEQSACSPAPALSSYQCKAYEEGLRTSFYESSPCICSENYHGITCNHYMSLTFPHVATDSHILQHLVQITVNRGDYQLLNILDSIIDINPSNPPSPLQASFSVRSVPVASLDMFNFGHTAPHCSVLKRNNVYHHTDIKLGFDLLCPKIPFDDSNDPVNYLHFYAPSLFDGIPIIVGRFEPMDAATFTLGKECNPTQTTQIDFAYISTDQHCQCKEHSIGTRCELTITPPPGGASEDEPFETIAVTATAAVAVGDDNTNPSKNVQAHQFSPLMLQKNPFIIGVPMYLTYVPKYVPKDASGGLIYHQAHFYLASSSHPPDETPIYKYFSTPKLTSMTRSGTDIYDPNDEQVDQYQWSYSDSTDEITLGFVIPDPSFDYPAGAKMVLLVTNSSTPSTHDIPTISPPTESSSYLSDEFEIQSLSRFSTSGTPLIKYNAHLAEFYIQGLSWSIFRPSSQHYDDYHLRFLLFIDKQLDTSLDDVDFDQADAVLQAQFTNSDGTLVGVHYDSDPTESTAPKPSVWVPEMSYRTSTPPLNADNYIRLIIPSHLSIPINTPLRIVGQSSSLRQSNYQDIAVFRFDFQFNADMKVDDICTLQPPPTSQLCNKFDYNTPLCPNGQVWDSTLSTPACIRPQPRAMSPTLPCKSPLEVSSDGLHCVCRTKTCAVTTRQFMLYMNPSSTMVTTIRDQMSTGFYNLLDIQLTSLLKLYGHHPDEQIPPTIQTIHTAPISIGGYDYVPSAVNNDIKGIICTVEFAINPLTTVAGITNFEEYIDNLFNTQLAPILEEAFTLDSNNQYSTPMKLFFTSKYFSPSDFTFYIPNQNYHPHIVQPTPHPPTALCESYKITNGVHSLGRCPFPSQKTSSHYWSCSSSTTSPATTTATTKIVCADIYGNGSVSDVSNSLWCQTDRFHGVPRQSTVSSCLPAPSSTPVLTNLQSVTPIWTPQSGPMTTVYPGSTVYFTWSYTGPDDYTIAIFIKGAHLSTLSSADIGRVLLRTVAAQPNKTALFIPFDLVPTSAQGNTRLEFFFQIVQNKDISATYPSSSSTSITIGSLYQSNPHVRTCANAETSNIDGYCTCPNSQFDLIPTSLPLNYESSSCTCTQSCISDSNRASCNVDVNPARPTCECKGIFDGINCLINNNFCSKTSPNNKCLNDGQPIINHTLCTESSCPCNWDKCQCQRNWVGALCDTCSLQCDTNGTDFSSPLVSSCTECVCKKGYGGRRCHRRSLMGTIRFVTRLLGTRDPSSSSSINDDNRLETMSHSLDAILILNNGNDDDYHNDDVIVTQFNHQQSSLLFDMLSLPPGETTLPLTTQSLLSVQIAASLGVDQADVGIRRVNTTVVVIDGHLNANTINRNDIYNTSSLGDDEYEYYSTMSSLSTFTPLQKAIPTTTITTTSTTFDIHSSSRSTTTNQPLPIGQSLSSTNNGVSGEGASMTDLYDQWTKLQKDLPSYPIADPTTQVPDFGPDSQLDSAADAFDPICGTEDDDENNDNTICPNGPDPTIDPLWDVDPPSRNSKTTLIIALVVSIVVAILLFIGLIVFCKYAHKHQILCFTPGQFDGNGRKAGYGTTEMSVATNTTSSIDELGTGEDLTKTVTPMSSTADLIPIKDDEVLPEGWSKFKHSGTDEIVYINLETMVSQRNAPGTVGKQGKWF